MTATPSDLLAALIVLYWRGGVTQDAAAKFLGIRKASFVELANGYLFIQIIENAGWRYYLRAFHEAFPGCDQRSVRRDSLPSRVTDNLLRGGKAAPVVTFGPEEAARLPAAHGHLMTTRWASMDDALNGNECRGPLDKIDVGNDRSPASLPRALARAKGQQQFDERELDELSFDGPEFAFDAEDASHRGGGSVLGP